MKLEKLEIIYCQCLRLQRIAERMKIREDSTRFKWVEANGML